MKRIVPSVLALAMVVVVAGTVTAAPVSVQVGHIIFTLGNNPQQNETNILFTTPQTGATINGFVGQSSVEVDFTTLTGQNLQQKAQGQADIFDALGEGPNDLGDLTSMEVTVPGYTWGDFILNLQNGNCTGTGQSTVCPVATVTVYDTLGNAFEYTLGNGQNYLTITTDNGSTISKIDIMAAGGFDEFKQPRISDVCAVGGACLPANVPEPTSLLLLGSGLVGLATVARRRRNRK